MRRLPELCCCTVSVYLQLCVKQWCITEQADICSFLLCALNSLPSDKARRLSAVLSLLLPPPPLAVLFFFCLFSFFSGPNSMPQIKWPDPTNIWRIQLHKEVRQRPGDSLTGPPPLADLQRCHRGRRGGLQATKCALKRADCELMFISASVAQTRCLHMLHRKAVCH